MGNRGQKRAEVVEELPADKRACSSLEFGASSSVSALQSHTDSTNSLTPEDHGGDMDTDSSASTSDRSDGDGDKEDGYDSCDSDEMGDDEQRNSLSEYQERRALSDHGKIQKAISSLNDDTDLSKQLAALTELCELLSFCTQSSMSSSTADSLSPALVKLAKHESSPDIMLLAIRAITYLCDVYPRSSSILVRHDAIPVLCGKLMGIEYLDVAEQCLQALEKISRDQPLVCLQSGAIMAVLNYIDFFATSVQRVALSTVLNICKRLPSECSASFMEAVPILSKLLQCDDRLLVESVASCFIKVVEQVSQSPKVLEELCQHGLIHQVTHLVDLRSQITLSQPICTGLIGLLVKVASASILAVRTLFELNISSILKEILSSYDISHGMSSAHMVNGHHNQVCEVLKLLNELLPTSDQDVQHVSHQKSFLVDRPDLLLMFGVDIFPMLIQVVNSGANIYVCYGCLSIINKLVYSSKSEILLDLLKNTNISSFLAGVFTRKDHHVLNLALQIVETILQKLSDTYLNAFVKEGILFAIDALIMPEKCSQLMFPVIGCVDAPAHSGHKTVAKETQKCLCYAFDSSQSPAAGDGACKLEKTYVYTFAKDIRTNYFASELGDCEKGCTEILQNLRAVSSALTDLVNDTANNDASSQPEEFYNILHQIMLKLGGEEPISTFEFIESGIIKSLMSYLSNGLYLKENVEDYFGFNDYKVIERRFQVFARVLSSMDHSSDDLPLLSLIRRLQSALSSMENFPVISSNSGKQKSSYATVADGSRIKRPCMKVRFVRGEGETCLCDFYSGNVLTVDPLSTFHTIENFLWPKVTRKLEKSSAGQSNTQEPQIPPDVSSVPTKSVVDPMDVDRSPLSDEKKDEDNLAQSASERTVSIKEALCGETSSPGETHPAFSEEEIHTSVDEDDSMDTEVSVSSFHHNNASPKLLLYLEGKLFDCALTLYQAILQQQMKAEHEFIATTKFWSKEYTITYRKAEKPKQKQSQQSPDKVDKHCQFTPFNPCLFFYELASNLERTSPTYDILFLLRSLEGLNTFRFHLISHERAHAFAEGRVENLDSLKVSVSVVPRNEFINCKLTEKLEQQMRDTLSITPGGMPLWCGQLMTSSPFLFSFEVKCKFFRLAAFGTIKVHSMPSIPNNSVTPIDRRPGSGSLTRKKFLVSRDSILDSAARMMDLHDQKKVVLEVEYDEEVGTGQGPTLEFFTLVSNEFQKSGMGMWRGDHSSSTSQRCVGVVASPFGLFPRPWSLTMNEYDGIQFIEVIKRFVLLGQVVAKALQDGRVMDLPFSKAFYKLLLGQELNLYDIQSFDPELGKTLLEFRALFDRKRLLESTFQGKTTSASDSSFRNARIEDLFLDFTLPGYPEYRLPSGPDCRMVDMDNLGEYVSHVVDATINSGISRQMEAFKSGFNQVFPIKDLQIFAEEELERLLCGESDSWPSGELMNNIQFDHGYTASSPPIVNLLEIVQEFGREHQRAFLQFVTGAPRLPPGGLASLNPKLTIVRKHFSIWSDADLPSVMTCANYLKLPPYSSKDWMREKLLYAITEGQGSFHLS